jgi:SMC interacting uncharacterized protein involved in chromosome segregation
MAENRRPFEDEIQSLKTLRDELRVQVNLAAKEARDRFAGAEQSWHQLESRLARVRNESEGSLRDVGEAARALVKEIQEAYRHIRSLL